MEPWLTTREITVEITVNPRSNGVVELVVTGRLNMVTGPRVREAIERAVANNQSRIAVDLSGVVFLDSSGLGALIAGVKMARAESGDLRLIRPTEQVSLVLELTNMGSVLKSFDDVESAFPHE